MTRYPRSGKGSKWTIKALEAIPESWSRDTLSDGEGLSGEVRIASDGSGSVRFKYAYRWNGKTNWFQCGTWPKVSLEAIRSNRDHARNDVKLGINPTDKKKAVIIENQAKVKATIALAEQESNENKTFQEMYDGWLLDGVDRDDNNAEIIRSFMKDVMPDLENIPVRKITEHHLRALLRKIVDRGALRSAECRFNDLVQLFAWSEKRQPWRKLLIEGNPTDLIEIEKILPRNYVFSKVRERVLKDYDIREFRDIFVTMEMAYEATPAGSKYYVPRPLKKEVQLALWISLSTMCRIGELLMSEWREVDLEKGIWAIPVKNTKGKIKPLTVYLSPFALTQFSALYALTGTTPYCFPNRSKDGHVDVKSVSKLVGDCQTQFRKCSIKGRRNDNSLVLNNGKDGQWTPHDLRRTGSTFLQGLKVDLNVIDRCQNHVLEGPKTRRSYQHHEYLDEMREAWMTLGSHLEKCLGRIPNAPTSAWMVKS